MVRTPAAAGAAAAGAPPNPSTSTQAAIASLTSMDDIAADDDLLSDMLLDKLGFAPAISTHKMNPHYRSQRWNTEKLIDLVREKIMIERDVPAALEGLCQIPIIKEHMDKKPLRARGAFELHAKRYLEAYLPDSGFEFAITNRYIRSIHALPNAASLYDASAFAESSAAGAARSATPAPAPSSSHKATKPRRSNNATSAIEPEGLKKDLCVVALRAFQPGDVITCKGALKDLTKEQDEALRFEASHTRSSLAHETAFASDGARDFSIIRSTRRNCTQVLLGPARFVNHDCDPNAQFNKMGQHMTFKVIKPIQQNEEVLVLYGEHYFGPDNCECLCATCEKRGTGVFSVLGGKPPTGATNPVIDAGGAEEGAAAAGSGDGAAEGDIVVNTASSGSSELDSTRRAPSKRIKTASTRTSPNGDSPGAGLPPPSRNDSAILKALTGYEGQDRVRFPTSPQHNANRPEFFPSDRELVSPENAKGKLLRCLTCRAPFFTAAWYDKDECVRCERHFRIYQADYPYRSPTEAKWKKILESHEAKLARLANGAGKGQSSAGKRKAADALSDNEEDEEEAADVSSRKSKGKGKGKAVAKGKKGSNNAAQGRSVSSSKRKDAAATSPFSDSRSTSSRASSPVHLTPLRSMGVRGGGRGKDDDEDAIPRKPSRPRKSVIDMDTDEDTIERQLSSHGHTSRIPPPTTQADDSDSDLSDPPTNLSEAEGSTTGGRKFSSLAMSAAPSMESALSTSSEGSLERPCGPKMLGKEANVENLAKHWGIQDGEGRRIRKPSVNGPVSLADRVGPSSGRKSSGHRRTASATSVKLEASAEGHEDKRSRVALPPLSSKSKSNGHKRSHSREASSSIASPSKHFLAGREHSSSEERAAGKALLGSRVKQEAVTPEAFPAPGPSSSSSRKSKATPTSTATPPPIVDHNGIATHGTARTSTDNLSKAWSAPAGASRTRHKAVREPPSLLASVHRGGSPATSTQSRRGSSDAGRAGSRGKRGKSSMAEASPSASGPSSSGAPSLRDDASASDGGSDDEEQPSRARKTPLQKQAALPMPLEEHTSGSDKGGAAGPPATAGLDEANGGSGDAPNGPTSSPGGTANAAPRPFTHVRRNLRFYHSSNGTSGATASGSGTSTSTSTSTSASTSTSTSANNGNAASQPLAAITGSATNGASTAGGSVNGTNGSARGVAASASASEPPLENTNAGGAGLLPAVSLSVEGEEKPLAGHGAPVSTKPASSR